MLAPSEFKHAAVASMSAFVSVHIISTHASPSDAQIRYLCASDFDEIAEIMRFTLVLLKILSTFVFPCFKKLESL